MIVRIVTYGARSLEAGRKWGERRGSELRAVDGVEKVDFIQQEDPDRIGAIIHFESLKHLKRYKESGPYQEFVEDLKEKVLDPNQPVRDEVFELLDI